MKLLPDHDLEHVCQHSPELLKVVRENFTFVIFGHNGFIGSWLGDSLWRAGRKVNNGVSYEFARLPIEITCPVDYAIVCPTWDVKIDWMSTFKTVRKAVLFVSSGAAEYRNDAIGHKKRANETALIYAAREYGFEAKIARVWTVIGPRQKLGCGQAAPEFLDDALKGRRLTIRGNPHTVRSYLYVADVAIWLWSILFKGKNGVRYNVGSEVPTTIFELADAIAPQPCGEVETIRCIGHDQPLDRYVPNTEKTRSSLGLSQHISLGEAIRRTKAWQALP